MLSPLSETNYWPAPAKINRFLHITGRRADGYHLLQTLFQFLDYGDELGFTLNDSGTLTLESGLTTVAPEDNLVIKAARRLQQQSGTPLGATLELRKRLPLGAGLGGGSSDAATTLVALNQLWQLGYSTDELAAIGLTLGADVPVFVRGEAAWGEGIGEILTPVTLLEPWFLVVVPPVHVCTAELFRADELTRDQETITICAFLTDEVETTNVFQPLVVRRYPVIGAALEWLNQYGQARLTGTGAALFAPFASRQQALAVAAQLPDSRWQAYVARGLNRSPLQQRLEGALNSME